MSHIADGTALVFLGVLLVAIERPGLAAVFGALGIYLLRRGAAKLIPCAASPNA